MKSTEFVDPEEIPQIQTWLDVGDTGVISGYLLPLFQIPTELLTASTPMNEGDFHSGPAGYSPNIHKLSLDLVLMRMLNGIRVDWRLSKIGIFLLYDQMKTAILHSTCLPIESTLGNVLDAGVFRSPKLSNISIWETVR